MKQNNSNFKSIIKKFNTSKTNLICVKIPDYATNINLKNSNVGCLLWYGDNEFDTQFFVDISKTNLNAEIIGCSHNLSDSQILSICENQNEFYQVLSNNNIMYNYSAWTGKWIVIKL